MKLDKANFRYLYRNFFAIDDFFSLRRLKKLIDFTSEGLVIVYFKVDNQKLCMQYLGNVTKEGYTLKFDKEVIDKNITVPFEELSGIKVKKLGKEVEKIEYYSDIIKEENNKYNILETRNMIELDPFRDDAEPDQVYALLEKEGEALWVKMLGVQSKGLLICQLLETSESNPEYIKDELVGVLYSPKEKEGDEDKLLIKGHLIRR